jgi:hypothetical protein
MIIYSNGCSHTEGHNIDSIKTWPHFFIRGIIGETVYEKKPNKIKNKNLIIRSRMPENRYENILYNEGKCGAGNDYIFHRSLETISKLIQNNEKPDYALIQWSGPNRRQHCLPDGEILYVNLFDNTEYNIKFEPMGSMHTLHYIFVMQEFLKKHNINYTFLSFMALDESIKKLNIYKEIDLDKFLYIENDSEILFNGILSHLKKEHMTFDFGGHANKEGNIFVANELLKKLGFQEVNYNNKLC